MAVIVIMVIIMSMVEISIASNGWANHFVPDKQEEGFQEISQSAFGWFSVEIDLPNLANSRTTTETTTNSTNMNLETQKPDSASCRFLNSPPNG